MSSTISDDVKKAYVFLRDHLSLPKGYYRKCGSFLDRMHSVCTILDNVCGSTHYGFDIIFQITVLSKKPVPEFASLRDEALYARLALSASRFFTALEKLITGKVFFEQEYDGVFKRDEFGNKIVSDWLEIAATLSLLGARILAPVSWTIRILRKHVRNEHLNVHASRVGIAMCVFYTGCSVFSFAKATKDLLNVDMDDEKADEKLTAAILDAVSAVLNFLAMPWETGAIVLDGHPVVNLVGSVIGFCAHSFDLVRHAVAFDIKKQGVAYTKSWDPLNPMQ